MQDSEPEIGGDLSDPDNVSERQEVAPTLVERLFSIVAPASPTGARNVNIRVASSSAHNLNINTEGESLLVPEGTRVQYINTDADIIKGNKTLKDIDKEIEMEKYKKKTKKRNIITGLSAFFILSGGVSFLALYAGCKIPGTEGNIDGCGIPTPEGELQYDPKISANKDDLWRGFSIKNTNSDTISVQNISFISQLPIHNIVINPDVILQETDLTDGGYQYTLLPKNGTSSIDIKGGETKSLMNYTLSSVVQGNFDKEFSSLPYNVTSSSNNITISIPVVGEVAPHQTPEVAVLGTITRDQITINDPQAQQLKSVDALVYRSLLVSGDGNLYSSWSPEEVRIMNLLELSKKQTGNQIWLALSSICSKDNSVNFPLVLSTPDLRNKTTDSISNFINTKGLGKDIFDGVVIDYQYWLNACTSKVNENNLLAFIISLRGKLGADKSIYLSIPQGYRIGDIKAVWSEIGKYVTGFHMHTDAPQHNVVTPKVQVKELPDSSIATDPTYNVLKGNSTEYSLGVFHERLFGKAPIVVNFPSMGQSYNGANVQKEWGYGGPFSLSTEIDPASIPDNSTKFTFISQDKDPYSYKGSNGERGVDINDNVAVSLPTPEQMGIAMDVMVKNDNLFPKWLAVKDMYSGKSLIESAHSFFHNKPSAPSTATSLISAAVDVIAKFRKQ